MDRRRLRLLPLLALLCAFFATSRPAAAISDAELDQASRQEAAATVRQHPLVQDPAIVGRFQNVFARVAPSAGSTKWPLRMYVLQDSDPNAFALPNGMLFVNTGLLALNPNDDELAFVMSHEISHVTLEHAKKDINAQEVRGTILSILTGGRNTLVQLAGQVIDATAEGGFSRGQESQADLNALTVMANAGYNPAAALTFFQKLAAVEGRSGGIRAFAAHPLTSDRIKNVQKWLAAHPQYLGAPTQPAIGTP